MFFLYVFILCPLQFTSHLPLDICCWWWYLLYPVWYSVTSYPRMIYKPPMSYPQWSTSDLLLPLGMISLQSFFIILVHLFMQSGNSCRYDDTEYVMFGLVVWIFMYLKMLKGWKILHRKETCTTTTSTTIATQKIQSLMFWSWRQKVHFLTPNGISPYHPESYEPVDAQKSSSILYIFFPDTTCLCNRHLLPNILSSISDTSSLNTSTEVPTIQS